MFKSAVLSVLTAFLFISCGAVKVNYDYDKQTDFTNYSTYNYYSDINTGLSELDEKRLLGALDIALKNKGMQLAEEPDFFINITSGTYQPAQNSNFGVGIGGGGGAVGGSVSMGIPVPKKLKREIKFDFVDGKKDELFWEATSNSSFNDNSSPDKKEESFVKLVEKVLLKYPPAK